MTLPHANPAGADDDHENGPDSGPLRVSTNTAHESGIPPARERLTEYAETALRSLEHLEIALVESTRAEANISLLMRGLQHLGAGAKAAREANASLFAELEGLRQDLASSAAEASQLRQRVEMLTNLLEAQKRETERERELWIHQEDAFLVELMTDYERRLDEAASESQRQVSAIESELAEARTERDAARDEVRHITYERDVAMAALTEPAPPPNESLLPETERSQTPFEIGYLKLRKAPLKQKPDSSTRPLIGYSVGADELAEETLEAAALGPRSKKE